ncbi:MAG: FHA domain-containing protein [Anaerolineales bacterium]|uniref:FHA domain-containing protein n=1 Tax=Candidatus Desulfolinea nitratireducens TaxID=2841698 RepID=A0A8J6NMD4_9CHLR|nr:FHA domain-containing protein [Candidatus Desulfolinea nitratireducens]MBL6959492.1 FHA domain-containing protein [Anaerolineales bacterium]
MCTEEIKLPAALLVMENSSLFKFNQAIIKIGRARDNDLIIEHSKVSRKHAEIRYQKERFEVIDLDSTGGTYVNGNKIDRYILSKGDVITLANFHLVFGEEEFPVVKSSAKYKVPDKTDKPIHDTSIIYKRQKL